MCARGFQLQWCLMLKALKQALGSDFLAVHHSFAFPLSCILCVSCLVPSPKRNGDHPSTFRVVTARKYLGSGDQHFALNVFYHSNFRNILICVIFGVHMQCLCKQHYFRRHSPCHWEMLERRHATSVLQRDCSGDT